MREKMLAYHFDLKRAMWRRQYMDAMVDRLKAWGFNTIVCEVEDKLRFSRHPAIVHPDAPPHRETRDFVASCRVKGVEVVPLVQSLGHAEYVVGKPQYAHLRETPEAEDQYDPLSEEARSLILELFDEVIDVMQPAEFFHMGGDETWSLGKSEKCAPLVRRIGIGGLYLRHMLPLFEHVRSRGLRPMIWADIVLSHPEVIPEVPDYVVMVDWDYFTREERPRQVLIWGGSENGGNAFMDWQEYSSADSTRLSAFREHLEPYCVDERTRRDGTFRGFYCADALRGMGFDVITASANRCYGDMTGVPRNEQHLPNCFLSARKGFQTGMGNLVTSWAVRHNHPEVDQAGTFAAARALRSQEPFDADAVYRTFTADFFGTETPEFAEAARKAEHPFRSGQACHIQADRSAFEEGEDPVRAAARDLKRSRGGRKGAARFLQETREGYREARTAFAAMRERARKNARALDFWMEGVDLNAFYAEFLLAAVSGRLQRKAPELLAQVERLRENTRALFARTYTPRGLEEELDLRYGFHESYLRGLLQG